MRYDWDDYLFYSLVGLTFGGFVAFVVALAVYFHAALTNEADCLSKGYPKSYVTYDLTRYCANLDGTVTIKVEKQK